MRIATVLILCLLSGCAAGHAVIRATGDVQEFDGKPSMTAHVTGEYKF